MARNRSEKLPRCRQAHVYANAAEKWLANVEADVTDTLPFDYWTDIPISVRDKINEGTSGSDGGGIRGGRKRRIAYIREHYAA